MRHSLEHLLQARISSSPDCLWKCVCSGWIESRLWMSTAFRALEQRAAGGGSSLHWAVILFKQWRGANTMSSFRAVPNSLWVKSQEYCSPLL